MAESNNNAYRGNRTLLNASHLKIADNDNNGYGDILWARDIDWNDISISSNLWGYDNLTSLIIIQKLEELLNRVTALENQTPTPIIPVDPTLTISNPASTTIADGGSTTITVASNVEGKLTLTTASGTGWNATSSSTSTAATSHTITVTNLTAITTAGSIAAGGIVATFTPTDTTKYNTLTSQNVLKQTITLSAAASQTTYYYYAGWTLPTASNVDTIINETYPAESGSSIMNTAGKKTTSKSSMNYLSNKLYNANQKTNYYVLVPTGHAIYDSLDNDVSNSVFVSQGNITVSNQIHTIYKSKATSRNINAIIIK